MTFSHAAIITVRDRKTDVEKKGDDGEGTKG